MDKKKVSIIVPVYNVEKYLHTCLDSIQNQTFENWECILIDDGSLDNSKKICDDFANIDKRFKVIHKKNGGAASAKNIGLDLIEGDYVAFIDSDDYVEYNWLELVLGYMEKYEADIVEYGFDNIYVNRTVQYPKNCENTMLLSNEEYLSVYFDRWSTSLFWNKIFHSKLLKYIRFKTERRCIDDEFFTYKVISYANKIAIFSDELYHYRQRKSSAVSNSKNYQQITNDALDVLIERYQWICSRFPKLRGYYLEHDINILFYFSKMSHNTYTISKFKEIRKYYLKEILKYKYWDLLKIAIQLQFISQKYLLTQQKVSDNNEGEFEYFE